MAAGAGAVQAHLRRRRAEPASRPGQRRQAVEAPARRDAVRPGRHVEPVQARELSLRRRSARAASPRPSPETRTRPATRASTRRSTGPCRAPTPGSTATTTSTPSASCCWSRPARPGPRAGAPTTTTAAERIASSARSRCASSTAGQAAARPGRQPRHQLPGQDSRRRRLDVPDARQATAWC